MLSTLRARVRAIYEWYQRPGTKELRGQTLLREWLSPEQLLQLDQCNYFDVTGNATGKRYRIRFGRELNVFELDDSGRVLTGWCFVPDDRSLVAGDIMLAQKVALETNEWGALAVARRFAPRGAARAW
jgi:hypothetical protein